MFIPALEDAANDLALRGRPLAVYCILLFELDIQVFRSVRITETARRIKINRNRITEALHLLVSRGYLDRRRAGSTGPYRYRLRLNRIPVEVSESGHAA